MKEFCLGRNPRRYVCETVQFPWNCLAAISLFYLSIKMKKKGQRRGERTRGRKRNRDEGKEGKSWRGGYPTY